MGILGRISDSRRKAYLRKRVGTAWEPLYFEKNRWPAASIELQPDGSLKVPEFDLNIPVGSKAGVSLLLNEHLWSPLRNLIGANLSIQDDAAVAEIDGLRLRLDLPGDFDTLREVFLERSYRYEWPGEHLKLDIGANIGLASLYLARYYPGPVHAYELVPSTAKRARANFALNPNYSSDITFHEYGLGESDATFDLGIDPGHTAGNSMFKAKGSQIEKVQVRDAAAVLSEVVAEKGNRSLVVKLDAEGAEYGILRRWDQTDLLKQIDILMMEWHYQEGESLEDVRHIFRSHGFRWFESQKWDTPHGFLYAMGGAV